MKKYYVKLNEAEQGPYSAKEVRDMNLGDNVMVRMEGEHVWKPAGLYNFEQLMVHDLLQESRKNYSQEEDLNQAVIDMETRRWNWGACLLPSIWGSFNGVWWPLIILPFQAIPIVRLVVMLVMGSIGGRKAWEKSSWSGIKHYTNVQHNWAVAGVILFVVRMLVILGYGMLMSLMYWEI